MWFLKKILILTLSLSLVVGKPAEEDGQAVVNMQVDQNQQAEVRHEPETNQPANQEAGNRAGAAREAQAAVNEQRDREQRDPAKTDDEDVDWGFRDNNQGVNERQRMQQAQDQIKEHLRMQQEQEARQEQLKQQQQEQLRQQQLLQQQNLQQQQLQQQELLIKQKQQQQQQQQQALQQQQADRQQQQQQRHQPDLVQEEEQVQPPPPEHQQQHDEERKQHGENDIGVVNPEHLIHGDEGHDHRKPENVATDEEKRAEMERQGQLRFQAEQMELQDLRPVVSGNVHDSGARKMAEFMRRQPFQAGMAEEAIHEGGHVHDEDHQGHKKDFEAGNLDVALDGERRQHKDKEKDDKPHMTVDLEELMHSDGTGEHGHDPHSGKHVEPGFGELSDIKPKDDRPLKKKEKSNEDNHPIGQNIESFIHGEGQEHVHDANPNYKPKNKVRYQDIIDLGLDQELLKGIDLNKLLEQERQEMENWKEQASKDDNSGEDSENGKNAWFWQQKVNDLRKQYMQKLYNKVRHISNPDLENAEWDDDDDHVRGGKISQGGRENVAAEKTRSQGSGGMKKESPLQEDGEEAKQGKEIRVLGSESVNGDSEVHDGKEERSFVEIKHDGNKDSRDI